MSGLITELVTYTDSPGTVYTPICDGCDGVKVYNPVDCHSVGDYVLDKSPCDHMPYCDNKRRRSLLQLLC